MCKDTKNFCILRAHVAWASDKLISFVIFSIAYFFFANEK